MTSSFLYFHVDCLLKNPPSDTITATVTAITTTAAMITTASKIFSLLFSWTAGGLLGLPPTAFFSTVIETAFVIIQSVMNANYCSNVQCI